MMISALIALSLSAWPFAVRAAAPPRPQLLLPTQELQLPADLVPWDVAVAGEWIAVGGSIYPVDPIPTLTEQVYLYRRGSNGVWGSGTLLFSESSDQYSAVLEMNDSILVVSSGVSTHVFEKSPTGWLERTMDPGVAALGYAKMALDGTTVLLGDGRCGATGTVLERTSAAHWAKTGEMHGTPKQCGQTQFNPLVALSGNTAILWDTLADRHHERARVYERSSASTWTHTGFLTPPSSGLEDRFGTSLAMRGSLALVGGVDRGAYVYRPGGSGWVFSGYLATLEHLGQFSNGLRIDDRYIIFLNASSAVDSPVLHVVREGADQEFEEVAQLTTPHRTVPLQYEHQTGFDMSGSSVVSATADQVFFYQLPESPGTRAPLQYDFEAGATADWSIVPGGKFSVAQSGRTRVYRQAWTVGKAGAVLAEDLTTQAIEALITPRKFDGNDRWFGLVTRYTDESNFYYVTVRNRGAGVVSLRRMRNGVFTELAAAPVAVALGKPLRIRLESTVDRQTVFVDDQQYLSAVDDTLPHGRAGLRTYRAAADFDNVIVSASPTALYVSKGFQPFVQSFDIVDGQWGVAYFPSTNTGEYRQSSIAGEARSVAWPVSDDQVGQTKVRVDQFATGGDPWAGLVARYQDAANYYYVTLRRSNQVSLRRLVDGHVTVLGSAPVPPNGPNGQTLRLEVVGNKLRLFVDGRFMFETTDDTFASGKAGLVTCRTAASFLNFSAYRP
jgi:hypothetical protein